MTTPRFAAPSPFDVRPCHGPDAPDGCIVESVARDGFFLDEERVRAEVGWLQPHFPEFRWYRHEGAVFAEGPLRTNGGTTYAVRVVLPHDYPNAMPTALVTYPTPICDAKGRSLAKIGVSPEMHLLGTENGLPKLCHYRSDAWTSRRTVYQVVVKARLWFEAFEFHRQTGKPLDYWLGHV